MPPVALEVEEEGVKLTEEEDQKTQEENERKKEADAVSRPSIGIIYPPPEVRSILWSNNHFVLLPLPYGQGLE